MHNAAASLAKGVQLRIVQNILEPLKIELTDPRNRDVSINMIETDDSIKSGWCGGSNLRRHEMRHACKPECKQEADNPTEN